MYLESVTNRGATPALIQTLSFAQARHRMLAENIANWQTPGFKAKQLDARAFQGALREALEEKGKDGFKPLMIRSTKQFGTEGGRLRVTPTEGPAANVLFHDGTNGSIDRMMTDLADNAMVYQAATQLLKGNLDGIRKAIRGSA